MRVIYIFFVIVLLSACALPESSVNVGDERPRISFSGVTKGDVFFVDGLEMGSAQQYNGKPNVLLLEKGRHKVEVRSSAGKILLSEEVYLGSTETRTFSIGQVETKR